MEKITEKIVFFVGLSSYKKGKCKKKRTKESF
jgi:hypothetical protein